MMTQSSTDPPGQHVGLGPGAEALGPPLEEGGARAGSASTWRTVYTIVERGGHKKIWLRIGVAFVNRDGSLNVRLDAMPVSGQLHIRDSPPRDRLESRDGVGELFSTEREPRASWRD